LAPHRTSTVRSRRRRVVPALAIFARSPIPGQAKTRLIPLLGPRGAAEFHAALVSDVIRKVNAIGNRVSPYFFLSGRDFPVSSSLSDYTLRRQQGKDLGARLDAAFRQLLRRRPCAVVVGTDSPALAERVLLRSIEKLQACDAVLGPCPDGGFYLIGLRRITSGLFSGVQWGSDSAFRDMQANLEASGFTCSILEPLPDVDRPDDVERLKDELVESRAARRCAPSTWKFLKEFFVLKGSRKKLGDKAPAEPAP
jgi:uncharacterized protein